MCVWCFNEVRRSETSSPAATLKSVEYTLRNEGACVCFYVIIGLKAGCSKEFGTAGVHDRYEKVEWKKS